MIPALTLRALLVAVVLEMLWAGLVAYEVHRVFVGPTIGRASMPWDVQALNFMDDWAAPAIAIVVIVWLADRAVAQFTRSG